MPKKKSQLEPASHLSHALETQIWNCDPASTIPLKLLICPTHGVSTSIFSLWMKPPPLYSPLNSLNSHDLEVSWNGGTPKSYNFVYRIFMDFDFQLYTIQRGTPITWKPPSSPRRRCLANGVRGRLPLERWLWPVDTVEGVVAFPAGVDFRRLAVGL